MPLRKLIVLTLAGLLVFGMPARIQASELEQQTIGKGKYLVLAYSKEYSEKKRDLEREREEKKKRAFERGKEEDKTTGFLLGCLLGGVGIIIAYVMD